MPHETIAFLNLLKSNIVTGVQLAVLDFLTFGNPYKVIGYIKVGCLKTLDFSSLFL